VEVLWAVVDDERLAEELLLSGPFHKFPRESDEGCSRASVQAVRSSR
jgi:hypothetical protein